MMPPQKKSKKNTPTKEDHEDHHITSQTRIGEQNLKLSRRHKQRKLRTL
jgi:hypothetical protein